MKTVISFNQDTNGNSLYSELPDGGKEIVFEWLHKLKFIDIVVDIIWDIQSKEKYSGSLPLLFDSKPFTLYSHYGVLRIGKGQSVELPDNFIDQWIEDIQTFTL